MITYHTFFHSLLLFVWFSGKRMIISSLKINWGTQQCERIVLAVGINWILKYHLEKVAGFKELSFWVTAFQDWLKPSQLCTKNFSACRIENQQVDLLPLTTAQPRVLHRRCSASPSQRAASEHTVKIWILKKETSLIAFDIYVEHQMLWP